MMFGRKIHTVCEQYYQPLSLFQRQTLVEASLNTYSSEVTFLIKMLGDSNQGILSPRFNVIELVIFFSVVFNTKEKNWSSYCSHSDLSMKQGCAVVFVWFCISSNSVIANVTEKEFHFFKPSERHLAVQLCIDDKAILSLTQLGLRRNLWASAEFCKEERLSVNHSKTSIMIFLGRPKSNTHVKLEIIKVKEF